MKVHKGVYKYMKVYRIYRKNPSLSPPLTPLSLLLPRPSPRSPPLLSLLLSPHPLTSLSPRSPSPHALDSIDPWQSPGGGPWSPGAATHSSAPRHSPPRKHSRQRANAELHLNNWLATTSVTPDSPWTYPPARRARLRPLGA